MLEEDRTEIIKEFENLQRIMSGLEKENEVILSVFCLSLHLKYTPILILNQVII